MTERVLRYVVDDSRARRGQAGRVSRRALVAFLERFGSPGDDLSSFHMAVRKAAQSFFNPEDGALLRWFHGGISREEATDLLLARGISGGFLVRWGRGRGALAVSYLKKKAGGDPAAAGEVNHVQLHNIGEAGFSLKPKDKTDPATDQIFAHVRAFLVAHAKKLRVPIAGELYESFLRREAGSRGAAPPMPFAAEGGRFDDDVGQAAGAAAAAAGAVAAADGDGRDGYGHFDPTKEEEDGGGLFASRRPLGTGRERG
ncbi:MAG: hypothetical protein GWP75_09335 [Planctomycetia bacterium]|nr:hypothetical protein [Planctomycetia bacterium]